MIHGIVLWMGTHFSPEEYLVWTRIQCVAWTAADLLIVFYLVRIANLGRGLLGLRKHRYSYGILALTVAGLPVIAWTQDGGTIFLLELLITVPHFLLILYLLAADIRFLAPVLARLLKQP